MRVWTGAALVGFCLALADGVGAVTPDTDGDGLSNADETGIYGTNPADPDTDHDGMPDGFEVAYALQPTNAADAGADPDGDLVTNVEEFQADASPRDSQRPQRLFFVSSAGDDEAGDGSLATPWRTLDRATRALDDLFPDNPASNKIRIVLEQGTYIEDVTLFPGVGLAGRSRATTLLIGRVDLAAGSELYNLTLQERRFGSGENDPLVVRMDDGPILLREVEIQGSGDRRATGLKVEGDKQAENVIINSVFRGLRNGIEIRESIPRITRNVFQEIAEDGVLFRLRGGPSAVDDNSFGDVSEAYSGYNVFLNVGGKAVVNERAETIKMQNNDWGTTNPEDIPDIIDGAALVPPVLMPAGQVLAGAVFCTVWDAETQTRIPNAQLQLTVTSFAPVTENTAGVYVFPAIDNGSYTVRAIADGYEPGVVQVSVANGGTAAPLVALRRAGGEGEGEGEDIGTTRNTLASGFDAADTDGSGGLSLAEAQTALSTLNEATFDTLDLNGDGQLSPSELGVQVGCSCSSAKALATNPMRALGDVAIYMLAGLTLFTWSHVARVGN